MVLVYRDGVVGVHQYDTKEGILLWEEGGRTNMYCRFFFFLLSFSFFLLSTLHIFFKCFWDVHDIV